MDEIDVLRARIERLEAFMENAKKIGVVAGSIAVYFVLRALLQS